MRPVFLSYAREDRRAAGDLARALESAGLTVWWDLQLSAGQEFDEEIERRLREAEAVVVLWSRNSVRSRWVKAEADFGAARGVLVPALLEEVEVPLPYGRIQSADLTDWDGEFDHRGVVDIRAALERVSRAPTPTAATPAGPAATGREAKAKGARRRLVWAALALVALLATVLALWLTRRDPAATATVVVPEIIGMRLDEARLQLDLLGIHGPGVRDADGEPFQEDRDLETITRVHDVSPPPGSSIPRRDLDLTLYLEFCNGRCEPSTSAPTPSDGGASR